MTARELEMCIVACLFFREEEKGEKSKSIHFIQMLLLPEVKTSIMDSPAADGNMSYVCRSETFKSALFHL